MCTEGVESLLQLAQSGSTTTRLRSKRVLSICDFGAKGDGITNDTKVIFLGKVFNSDVQLYILSV